MRFPAEKPAKNRDGKSGLTSWRSQIRVLYRPFDTSLAEIVT